MIVSAIKKCILDIKLGTIYHFMDLDLCFIGIRTGMTIS